MTTPNFDLGSLKLPQGAAVMLSISLMPIHVAAVWTCRVCKRVSASPLAGVYWDGTNLFGLICPERHDAEEISSAIALTKESSH